MMLDARSIAPDTVLKTKYCVIGSGMGGSAVAQKLAGAKLDVLLIEAGGFDTHDESRSVVRAEMVGRPFRRPPTRCIELGGSSNQWHGMCAALDDIDFESRPWVPHSGWPISRANLHGAYLDACEMHGVEPYDRFLSGNLPEPFRGPAHAIQIDEQALDRKLFQYRKSPRRWKNVLADLARSGRLRCLIHAPVLELITDADGVRVTQAVAGCGSGTLRIEADVFIICTGALETPRLLLNSRRRHAEGLGNSHDLVGRFLLDHPAGNFTKLKFSRTRTAPLYAGLEQKTGVTVIAGMSLCAGEQTRLAVPNHYFMIRPSLTGERIPDALRLSFLAIRGPRDLTFAQVRAILTNPDILNRVLVTRLGVPPLYRFGDLFFFTEQLPNPQSRIRLSPNAKDAYGYSVAQIDWQLSEADLRGFERYTEGLLERGLRSNQYSVHRRDPRDLWDETVASAAHHAGTARMAGSRAHGVVDAHLKVFDVANLYVADASVFPTAGSSNPSLTVTALAIRLASDLIAKSGAAEIQSAA